MTQTQVHTQTQTEFNKAHFCLGNHQFTISNNLDPHCSNGSAPYDLSTDQLAKTRRLQVSSAGIYGLILQDMRGHSRFAQFGDLAM